MIKKMWKCSGSGSKSVLNLRNEISIKNCKSRENRPDATIFQCSPISNIQNIFFPTDPNPEIRISDSRIADRTHLTHLYVRIWWDLASDRPLSWPCTCSWVPWRWKTWRSDWRLGLSCRRPAVLCIPLPPALNESPPWNVKRLKQVATKSLLYSDRNISLSWDVKCDEGLERSWCRIILKNNPGIVIQ